MTEMDRRTLLRGTGAALAAGLVGGAAAAQPRTMPLQEEISARTVKPMKKLELKFAVGYGMIGGKDLPMVEKFRIAKRAGFDGIEMDCPNPWSDEDVVKAVAEAGIPVHSVVDSVHWKSTLSHDDPAQREKGVAGLETAIRGAKAYGASDVLLVPAVVGGKVSHEQAWERSIESIRRVLPLAAELGIFILIENVWNRFGYEHDGPVDQPADKLAAYIDEIDSPWVRFYLDLGNHRKYASVPEWVRTLGSRIVKLHVKGYHRTNGWTDIGDDDIDWPGVCSALREIGFTGWVTAEVGGGDEARLAQVHAQMTGVFSH